MKWRHGADLPPLPWLEVVNPLVLLGRVRHALFDFDGTISVIRRGWDKIMASMMVEMICGEYPPTPEIESEVAEYVDQSTGILTIQQMRWLEDAVRRHGLSQSRRSARDYKQVYNERLLGPVRERLGQMNPGLSGRNKLAVVGARAFLLGLRERGVTLYLASGTDQVYVVEEASALGVDRLFDGRIFGARDDTEEWTKERIIQDILQTNKLKGEELLVVGDGPVEIQSGKALGAVTLGIAADEKRRQGLDPRKRQRLLAAGADLIVTDFSQHKDLLRLLLPGEEAASASMA